MRDNKGKKFEQHIRENFLKVKGVSIDRVHDQMTGFKGSQNICDFIVYREPYQYYIECKSVHGASLPFNNITDTQWDGLLEKCKIQGVHAGVLVWFVDKDITKYVPIQALEAMKQDDMKSLNYQWENYVLSYSGSSHRILTVPAKKKRVFFDYDMDMLLNSIADNGWGVWR